MTFRLGLSREIYNDHRLDNILFLPSPNFSDRGGKRPSAIIIHSFGKELFEMMEVLQSLKCDEYPDELSAHYIITDYHEPGKTTIIKMVDDACSANQAGISYFAGNKNLNDVTIGIEMHTGFDGEMDPVGFKFGLFSKGQMDSLAYLISDICSKYGINKRSVLSHADIAPTRKNDPGLHFDYRYLYDRYGIGYMPKIASTCGEIESIDWVINRLCDIGYGADRDNVSYCIIAYNLHFNPEEYDGSYDNIVVPAKISARLCNSLKSFDYKYEI